MVKYNRERRKQSLSAQSDNMNDNDIQKAIYIMQLKIAKEIRENKIKDYELFKNKITKLQEEKDKIYQNDKETINKVLTEYINDVKM